MNMTRPEVRRWRDGKGYSVIGEAHATVWNQDGTVKNAGGMECALVAEEFSDLDGGRLIFVCLRCWATSTQGPCEDIQAVIDDRGSIGLYEKD